MIKAFITSFKLKNTYRVNSIIYSIKQLPILKKILSNKLYSDEGLKLFGNIISGLIEFGSTFVGKLIYVLFCIFLMAQVYKTDSNMTFIHIFIFMTLIGGIMNTYMFNPTKDKYYAMIIMNMDARKYTLSNYYYMMAKTVIGFLPFTIIFGLVAKVPIIITLLMPIFVVMIKTILNARALVKFNKTKALINENNLNKWQWITIGILLLAAYGLPYIEAVCDWKIFLGLFIICLILGFVSFWYINKYDKYRQIYSKVLKPEIVYIGQKDTRNQLIKDAVSKQIVADTTITSNKTGFSYFHELFVKRHKKILTEAVKKQAFVLVVILIILSVMLVVNQNMAKDFNKIPLVSLPYFMFIMYMLNRGTTLTQAMFMNCDHSMLTYKIYRAPKVILGIFKERLKTLMILNVIPATIIGVGLAWVLYLTGGTSQNINYVVIVLSIISMSIFFSVHYLVLYYLLQPYTISTELKSATYKTIQMVTYMVCYVMIDLKMQTIYFGGAMIIFSILYSIISLYLVYRHAPKTFKIRV